MIEQFKTTSDVRVWPLRTKNHGQGLDSSELTNECARYKEKWKLKHRSPSWPSIMKIVELIVLAAVPIVATAPIAAILIDDCH